MTKEKAGYTPTSLRGLMLHKHLYHSRWKKDRAYFGRLFFIGLPFKRVKWLRRKDGQLYGEVLDSRTSRGRELYCHSVAKHFPNVFTKQALKHYLNKTK